MSWLKRINWPILAPAIILMVGLACLLTSPAGFRTETQTVSLQIASMPLAVSQSDTVALVDIDAHSLSEAGPWPWPRTQIAHLILAVHDAGAANILVALPFEGIDAAAPQRAVEAWGQTGHEGPATAALRQLPDTDQVLLDVMEQTGSVLVLLPTSDSNGAPLGDLAPLTPLAPVEFTQEGGEVFVPIGQTSASGFIASSAARRVALGLRYDFVGRPSGFYPVLSVDGTVLPTAASLPLLSNLDEAVQVHSEGVPGTLGFVDPVGMTSVSLREQTIATLPDGSVLLRRNVSAPGFSASNIMVGIHSEFLAGRTVIIGSSLETIAGADGGLVPRISAVQALTAAVVQSSDGTSAVRPFIFTWIEFLVALLGGALIIGLGYANRPWLAMSLAFISTAALFVAAVYLLNQYGILLDATAVGLLLIFSSTFTMVGAEDSPQNIRQRFGHAVEAKLPFGTPKRLIRNPKQLLEAADSRKITVLCCTIRDFADLQDLYKDDPEGLTNILHQFHDMVGNTVRSYGGTADRFGGATVLAFWNAPLEEPDHALKACDCGLRLIDALEKLNQIIEGQSYRTGKAFSPIHLGIGINTGRAVVGNVGSMKRPDYSAVGETVDLAKALLTASAQYGPAIIVGEHTYQAVKNRFALLEVDKLGIPARAYAIRVFALLGNPVTKASPRFRALEEAHASIFEAYRVQNWALAEALIRECRKLNGAIPILYDLYECRISYYRSFPPEAEWDGSFTIPVV